MKTIAGGVTAAKGFQAAACEAGIKYQGRMDMAMICSTVPCAVFSTPASLTQLSPMAFGRKGERVAKTPTRLFPPSLGGRTVGDHVSRSVRSKDQISHR